MKLNELKPQDGATKKATRVGRGIGSGKGKTSGSGQKGQKARSGVAINGFEGGQMPLYRRMPKLGFNNIFRKELAELSLGKLQEAIDAKKIDASKALDEAALVKAGVVRRKKDGIKLLGNGALKAKVELSLSGASKSAVAAVEKAGGKVTIVKHEPKPIGKKAEKKADKK
ncbi:MAG: 50S ribosomal protein L15 [Micavibrio sp.]|nr:MAG: 50S ribosomal protein L15 [Micavibrio sp.]